MRRKQQCFTTSVLLFSFLAGACQDLPTSRTPDARAPSVAASATERGQPDTAHSCNVSALTPDALHRYRYFQLKFTFPANARAVNGAGQMRRYRWLTPSGEVVSAANCRIPATPKAADMLDRRVGYDDRRRRPSGGDESTRCGTVDDPCLISVSDATPNPGENWWEEEECQEDGWVTWCDRSTTDGGAGGGWDPNNPDGCDPSIDPKCEKPLTETDNANIENALDTYLRPIDEITGEEAKRQCKEMRDRFQKMLIAAPQLVYRGTTTTKAGQTGVPPHTGAYDPSTGHMHFEPNLLDSAAVGNEKALRELANTALHETAHAMGYQHTDPIDSPWGPLYTEDYFNKLDAGEDSCMR